MASTCSGEKCTYDLSTVKAKGINCTIWSPNLLMYHKEIEKIPRRATKLVKSVTKLPYCDRLKKLGLTTLYYRRLSADVIQGYRIINKIDNLELSIFFSRFSSRPSRYNNVRLIKPRALTTIRQNSFFLTELLTVGMIYQKMLFWQIL